MGCTGFGAVDRAGGSCGVLFCGRSGWMSRDFKCGRKRAGQSDCVFTGISDLHTGRERFGSICASFNLGGITLAASDCFAWLYRSGAGGDSRSVCGAGILAGFLHFRFCAYVRGSWRTACLSAVWRNRTDFDSRTFCFGRAELGGSPNSGEPFPWGKQAKRLLWKRLLYSLRLVCRCAMCVYLIGVFCRSCPSGWSGRGAGNSLIDGERVIGRCCTDG